MFYNLGYKNSEYSAFLQMRITQCDPKNKYYNKKQNDQVDLKFKMAIINIRQCKRKYAIQGGGSKHENTCISWCIQIQI